MHKWDFAPSPDFEYVPNEQTADHVLTTCPIHWALQGALGIQFWMTKPETGLTPPLLAPNRVVKG